jgi:hypothetical protein
MSWFECWQCNGLGKVAGCVEDYCPGVFCDPDDVELCCAPSQCDVCDGKGGWPRESTTPLPAPNNEETTRK